MFASQDNAGCIYMDYNKLHVANKENIICEDSILNPEILIKCKNYSKLKQNRFKICFFHINF